MTTLLCVVGQHRGGTSATAGAVREMGVYFGSEANLMKANPDNPKGYTEHLGVVEAHDALLTGLGLSWDSNAPLPGDWIKGLPFRKARAKLVSIVSELAEDHGAIGVKDPRMARFCPLWRVVADDCNVTLRALLVVRDPVAVEASLLARHKDWDSIMAQGLIRRYNAGMQEWSCLVPGRIGVYFPQYMDRGGAELVDAVHRLVPGGMLRYNPRAVAATLDEELVHHG